MVSDNKADLESMNERMDQLVEIVKKYAEDPSLNTERIRRMEGLAQ